jgi:hypothetical protein
VNCMEDSKILAWKILAKGNNHKKKRGSRQYTCWIIGRFLTNL